MNQSSDFFASKAYKTLSHHLSKVRLFSEKNWPSFSVLYSLQFKTGVHLLKVELMQLLTPVSRLSLRTFLCAYITPKMAKKYHRSAVRPQKKIISLPTWHEKKAKETWAPVVYGCFLCFLQHFSLILMKNAKYYLKSVHN